MSDGGTFTAQWLCSKCKQPIEGSYCIVGSQALCVRCAPTEEDKDATIAKLRALCKEAGETLNKIHLEPGDDFNEKDCRICKLVNRLRAAGEG